MRALTIGLLLLGSIVISSAVRAAEQADATVRITAKSIAAGAGFSWGSGILTYKGKEYPFSISGFSAGDIGITSAEMSGEVFNLSNLQDFNGQYAAVGAGITVAGGIGRASMMNQNGVTIRVISTSQGLNFKLGVDGVKIDLK